MEHGLSGGRLGPGPIVVTGAMGFVASRLIPRLLERGSRVLALVRPGRDASRLEVRGVELRRGDLADPVLGAEAFAGAGAVVHLAGLALVPRFLGALERAGVPCGVFVSSAGVYTRLVSPGADAKRAGEARLRASALEATILRPSMIYGRPGDRNLERLLRWLARVPLVPLPGGGRVLQQPVHVDDLVEAIVASLERPAARRGEYDVGGPEPLPLRALIEQSAEALGRHAVLVPLPLRPVHALVSALRRAGLPAPIRPEQLLRLEESKAVDITPAGRDLGFSPRSFAEGIGAEAELLFGRR
jgi:uncharacterized protein YbjT (DUF2867 family)